MSANEVREVLNGVWAVSSLCVLILLLSFIFVERVGTNRWSWRFATKRWWDDSGVQLAGALSILIFGHMLRAAPQWVQFIMHNDQRYYDTDSILYYLVTWIFIPATVFMVAGKILCIWSIAPGEWNFWFAVTVLLVSVCVPLLVFLLV